MRTLSLLAGCAIAAAFGPAAADAATLRSAAALDTGFVHLSDLFDGAGPAADRVLGPAPSPGTRIVVEAAQLAAIARQFGVDWRPASISDRVLLDRPGRTIPRAEIMTVLRAALVGVGAPEDSSIDLPGFSPPLVPPEIATESAIEQIDYDAPSGRFTATLAVTGTGLSVQRMRLSGRLNEMVELPVPAHRLLAGAVVGSGDMVMQRVRASLVRGEVARLTSQATGMVLRHAALAGQPVPLADLARPAAVQKGALVTMELQVPGLALVAQGQAMESGALGDRVPVINPASRAVVEAEIVGVNLVRVQPGTAPVIGPRGGSAQVAVR